MHATWKDRKASVHLGDMHFQVIHYYADFKPNDDNRTDEIITQPYTVALDDLMASGSDFAFSASVNPITSWWGLRELIVLRPATNSDGIFTEDRRNEILSAFSIVTGNSGCDVPMFVEVHEEWRMIYYGLCQNRNFVTHFDTIHLQRFPPKLHYLGGLLDVFKEKVVKFAKIIIKKLENSA